MKSGVLQIESTVARVFAGDQPRLLRALYTMAEELAKKLRPGSLEVQPGDRPALRMLLGKLELSPKRVLSLKQVALTQIELTVTVLGETSDAIDALKEVWALLRGAEDEEVEVDAEPGGWAYKTAAVIIAPGLIDRHFAGIAAMKKALASSHLIRVGPQERFRIEVACEQQVHGLQLSQGFVIEPRVASTAADERYFTASPLPSETHREVIATLLK